VTYDVKGGQTGLNGAGQSGNATGNFVNVGGGTVDGNIYGGISYITTNDAIGQATGNTVTISGVPDLAAATLYGGFVGDYSGNPHPDMDAFTANTLNLKTSHLTVAGLQNFEYLNFYLPATLSAGDTVLTVTGTADLTDGTGRSATVNIGIDGASSPLQRNDRVILIDAGTLVGAPANTTSRGEGMQGVTLRYEFDVDVSDKQLLATVTRADSDERSKALSEAYLSGLTLVNQSLDLATGQGLSRMLDASRAGMGSFGVIDGGSSRYDTGSHVDVDSLSLLAGLSGSLALDSGALTLGAFFSYGRGDYDTRNSFANAASVKSRGDSDYAGLGILARLDLTGTAAGHPYAEAHLQGGRVKTDFRSGDLVDSLGRGAKYDSSSNYYGAHLGAGYVWNLSGGEFDLYGKYLYARRGGDSARLNTGDPIRFDAVESQRLRIGGRATWTAGNLKPYAGLAWEHEFDGKARATAYGRKIDAPDLKGDTGIVELGLTLTPSKTRPLTIDLGIQGYAGQREGASGSIKMKYRF
jgi:outer membrane autotransporter protein